MFQEHEIQILQNIEGSKKASGLVVVIDVFRAFTTACFIIANGADKIIPVGDIGEAYELKRKHPEYILMGERQGVIQSGFDYGNSPLQILNKDFNNKTIILTTSAGTQGIANIAQYDEILTGAFVNIDAIIKHIQNSGTKKISLLCTGSINEHIQDEDALCANYIKNELLALPNDFNKIKEHLINEGFAKHFFDPKILSHPKEDFDLCMSLNRFDFILKAEKSEDAFIVLKKVRK